MTAFKAHQRNDPGPGRLGVPLMATCPVCFALVNNEQADLHQEWHDRLVAFLVREMLARQRREGLP